MKFIWSILLVCTMLSCHISNDKNAGQHAVKTENKEIVPRKDTIGSPIQRDLMAFVAYNDDGDYFLVTAQKEDSLFSFINDTSDDRSLLRGDMVDITWKTTRIEIAGDGGTQEQAEKIISIVKVKDGNVSKFRRHYQKPLKYTWPEEEHYSRYFLDKLYSLVEYYVANTNNELLKLHINNRDQLSYSIEDQIRDNKEYVMIGIATTSEYHLNTIQWLYVDKAEHILYEYDLPNDTLIRMD